MKLFKKTAALVLAACLVVSIAGCSNSKADTSNNNTLTTSSKAEDKTTVTLVSGKFSLPYTTTAKFNPLLPASELNQVLWSLIYDSLCEPDENYKPAMRLADSVDVKGTAVSVTLKSGLKFTDNSALTARDVKYSFELVMAHPESPYNSRLSNVASITANGQSLNITLKTPDPQFANLLDIPIIKTDSDKTGNAIGSGRFVYSRNGVNAKLAVNKNWYGGKKPIITAITLLNIPYKDAVMPSLSIGNTNYVYSDYGLGSLGSAAGTDSTPVNLNQLVYVGINTNKDRLNNADFRKALSFSINRATLISQIYSNRALGTLQPFNPRWSELTPPTDEELNADYTKSAEYIASAGGAGTKVTYTLIVNKENSSRHAAANFIASSFVKAGVNVTVKDLSFDDYKAAIAAGNYDMYLGEVKLTNNMKLTPFLAGGSAANGLPSGSKAMAAYTDWQNGSKTISQVAEAFSDEMPFIPVCYHFGITSYTSTLGGVEATDSNIFYNFDKWGYEKTE